jgi:hypothetical protein
MARQTTAMHGKRRQAMASHSTTSHGPWQTMARQTTAMHGAPWQATATARYGTATQATASQATASNVSDMAYANELVGVIKELMEHERERFALPSHKFYLQEETTCTIEPLRSFTWHF